MHTFSSLVANTGCVKSTWVNVIKYTTFLRKVFLYKCSNYTLRPATILFMYSIQKLFIIAQFCSCQNVLLRSKVTRQTQQRALHILKDGNDVPLPHNHLHLHYKEKPRTKPSNNSQNRIHVQHSARGHKFFQPPKSATTAIRILKHKSASIQCRQNILAILSMNVSTSPQLGSHSFWRWSLELIFYTCLLIEKHPR